MVSLRPEAEAARAAGWLVSKSASLRERGAGCVYGSGARGSLCLFSIFPSSCWRMICMRQSLRLRWESSSLVKVGCWTPQVQAQLS